MFASETSGTDPKSHPSHLVPPESDNIFGSIPELPPDPLLYPGAFIHGNITSGETLTAAGTVIQDHVERDTTDHKHQTPSEPDPMQVPEPSDSFNGSPNIVAGTPNEVLVETPVPLNTAFPAKTPTRRGRRKKSDIVGMEMSTVSISSVKPEWLPTGWYVEDRVRTSGASAGATDKYYCDPLSGHKFRSKTEVIHFQQTGSRRKKVLKENTSDDATSFGSSGKRKEKKPRKTTAASKFDFVNVPEKIGWVLTDSSEGSWTPFVDDEKVPETSKEEWAATFTSLAMRSTG